MYSDFVNTFCAIKTLIGRHVLDFMYKGSVAVDKLDDMLNLLLSSEHLGMATVLLHFSSSLALSLSLWPFLSSSLSLSLCLSLPFSHTPSLASPLLPSLSPCLALSLSATTSSSPLGTGMAAVFPPSHYPP